MLDKMGCGIDTIKILLFVFNFIFAVCGLGILIVGVLAHLRLSTLSDQMDIENLGIFSVTAIVIGSIIFVISFFGCCGAIRSNHCMIVTFASMLMFILLIQVAIAVCAFVFLKSDNVESGYNEVFQQYPNNDDSKAVVNYVQEIFECCGVRSKDDYAPHGNFTGDIPGTCCSKTATETCPVNGAFDKGCVGQLLEFLRLIRNLLGGVAIGNAAVELIGIIFALCLANSIRNAERRGYRV